MTYLKKCKGKCESAAINASANAFESFMSYLFKQIIGIYRTFFSGYFGGSCRFYPSCSEYAEAAFEKHSFFGAFNLVFRRILSCHPLGRSGYDPLPEVNTNE